MAGVPKRQWPTNPQLAAQVGMAGGCQIDSSDLLPGASLGDQANRLRPKSLYGNYLYRLAAADDRMARTLPFGTQSAIGGRFDAAPCPVQGERGRSEYENWLSASPLFIY